MSAGKLFAFQVTLSEKNSNSSSSGSLFCGVPHFPL